MKTLAILVYKGLVELGVGIAGALLLIAVVGAFFGIVVGGVWLLVFFVEHPLIGISVAAIIGGVALYGRKLSQTQPCETPNCVNPKGHLSLHSFKEEDPYGW